MTAATKSKARSKPIEVVDMDELERILQRAKGSLSEEDHRKLQAAVDTLAYLTSEIEDKRTTIRHLRRLLFGPTSEKSRDILGDSAQESDEEPDPEPPGSGGEPSEAPAGGASDSTAEDPPPGPPAEPQRRKRPGHGRNGVEKYVGATVIEISHESLKPGDPCPLVNCEGRIYRLADPATLVRIVARPPLDAEIYRLERLRCNLCLTVFTARRPEGVGEEKFDASAVSMMANLRYGTGVPLHRLTELEKHLGIPLPESTQWEVVAAKVEVFEPVYRVLVYLAAQAEIIHNDDTTMRILELIKDIRERRESGEDPERTGMQTTGIVAERDGNRIALFFTGRNHAGENLTAVLAHREENLPVPIQMCDPLERNVPRDFKTILCNCNSHARRQFVDLVEDFPRECRFVVETFAEVFKNDATARDEGMSPQERLEFHRAHSRPLMVALRLWSWKVFKERTVEPNSHLGKAIRYMRRHWRKLTRFLYVPGAPISNNVCERILKRAIIHRKNSLFYKTENGARVGDLYMSLIATCQLAGANPHEYLVELQRHAADVAANPQRWLPWNYREALAGAPG
jgi:hypothetical protein